MVTVTVTVTVKVMVTVTVTVMATGYLFQQHMSLLRSLQLYFCF